MKDSTITRIEVVKAGQEIERVVLAAAYQFKNLMGQRKGQALMNALRMKQPELYDIITGTVYDCFFDDTKVPATLQELGFIRGMY